MNLGKMFIVPSTKPRKALSEINTAEPVFAVYENMDGTSNIKYHVNLIDLLDKVFIHNNQNFLSVEQDRFMDVFYKKADEVTKRLNTDNDNNPYRDMDAVMRQLDVFLGGYIGEDNGEYTR